MPTLTADIWAQQEEQEGSEEKRETKMKCECVSTISKPGLGLLSLWQHIFSLKTGVVVAPQHWAVPRMEVCSDTHLQHEVCHSVSTGLLI